jgi:protein-S-isoprenylcysteine O-methyltransferase Ste14
MRPPLLFLASIAVGCALEWAWPLPIVPAPLERALGAPLIAAAAFLFAWAVREFQAAGTPLPTRRPTTTIVTTGPYRFSRNPIYLSFTLLHLGVALWVDGGWLLMTLAVTLIVLTRGVIAREERYLARRFGQEYLAYRDSVRRWL